LILAHTAETGQLASAMGILTGDMLLAWYLVITGLVKLITSCQVPVTNHYPATIRVNYQWMWGGAGVKFHNGLKRGLTGQCWLISQRRIQKYVNTTASSN